jgi:hypothetical protein
LQRPQGDRAALALALDEMAAARPPGVFAGAYTVLQERERGCQSLVQFARDRRTGMEHYAIKFFFERCALPI